MTYKEEQEFLERAFITEMLFEHGITEVTTRRQYKNGTREFEFPVPSRKTWPNGKRLRLACFKTGYVRNQNSCSSNYQLNPVYKSERRQMFLTDQGTLKTYIYDSYTRVKIWNGLARMKFMLDFYLRNYKLNTKTNG